MKHLPIIIKYQFKNINLIVRQLLFITLTSLFYLGDTVVYQYGIATVIIEANDDPNGIFSLEPIDKTVEEGKTNAFW